MRPLLLPLSQNSTVKSQIGTLNSQLLPLEDAILLIPLEDSDRWDAALETVGQYDIYHRHEFHCLSKTANEEAVLFWQRIGELCLVVPLILRPLDTLPWYSGGEKDATSAYGYPGPLASRPTLSEAESSVFGDGLLKALGEQNIVSAFIRHHPLLTPPTMLNDATTEIGPSVWIDLSRPIGEQMADCRKKHRYEVRRAAKDGVTVEHDKSFDELEVFVQMYEERMRALDASQAYFFPNSYYTALTELADDACQLWHARLNGVVIGSALFFINDGVLQYHLSASRAGYERVAPARSIIEAVRAWATEQENKWLNLGGGVGGQEDSLYRFKAGFSSQRATFRVSRLIVDSERYAALCGTRDEAQETPRDEGFFPAYRA